MNTRNMGKIINSILNHCLGLSVFYLTYTIFVGNNVIPSPARRLRSSATGRKLEYVHTTHIGGEILERIAADEGVHWGSCHFLKRDDIGCKRPDFHYDDKNSPHNIWHLPPKKFISEKSPYQDADLFTIVRDPYARIFSEFYCPFHGYTGNSPHDGNVLKIPGFNRRCT